MAEQEMTIKELSALCGTINEMMARNQLNELEEFLRTLDYQQSLDYLLGTIRYSSPFRGHLKEWSIARDKVYIEMINRGETKEEADEMMQGLFTDDKGQGLEAFYKLQHLMRNTDQQ